MKEHQSAGRGWLAVLVLGAGVISLGIFRGDHGIQTYLELKRSREVMSAAVEGLRRENSELNAEILRLKQSPGYAKKVLRDKYHVTDENESIIFFAE